MNMKYNSYQPLTSWFFYGSSMVFAFENCRNYRQVSVTRATVEYYVGRISLTATKF